MRTVLASAASMAATAMSSLAAASVMPSTSGPHHMGRTRYPPGYVRGHSIAKANRWTGHPHEHKRAIERRLRQQQRINENQIARAKRAGLREFADDGVTELAVGLTRTGRKVFYTYADAAE